MPSTARRRPLILALRLLSLATLVTAIVVVVTGGTTLAWGGVELRLHRPVRIWLIGIALGLLAERLAGLPPWREVVQRLTMIAERACVIALALGAFVMGVTFGTFVAGGADSAGYVGQAQLWKQGTLQWPLPPIAATPAPWAMGEAVWGPLGWRLGPTPHTLVPTYSPGLPLMMGTAARVTRGLGNTIGDAIGGNLPPGINARVGSNADWGMWMIVPILGAIAVWAAAAIGRALGGSIVGLMAGLVFLFSPMFAIQLMQPMSDVPVAAWWTLAIALLARVQPAGRARIAAAGLAAAAAIATRPNLAPMLLPFVVFLVRADGVPWRTGLTRLAIFSLGVLPGVLLVAWLNATWFGSPLTSGYGSISMIFSLQHIPGNLRRYPTWLFQTHTPLIFVGLIAPLLIARHRPQAAALAWLCLSVALMNVVCYIAYVPFEDWTYLRFLLPAIPLLLVLSVAALRATIDLLLRAISSKRAPFSKPAPSSKRALFANVASQLATIAVCLAVTYRFLMSDEFFAARYTYHGESRYSEIAAYVDAALPRNAVLISMQHSGSLRYYTGRPIVRWDWMHPSTAPGSASLERACDFLRAYGFTPFFVLEEPESVDFKAHFAASPLGSLDWSPIVQTRLQPYVRIYDPSHMTPRRTRILP